MAEYVSRTMRKKKDDHGRRAVLIALFVLCVAVLALLWWTLFSPTGQTSQRKGTVVSVEIAKGSTPAHIARLLSEKGVVTNATMFRLQARLGNATGSLKAGVYKLEVGLGYAKAIEALEEGPAGEYTTVTIPEGLTVAQTARIVEKRTGLSAEKFIARAKGGASTYRKDYPFLKGAYHDSLEGFLFPDTYRVASDATEGDVITMMLKRFEQVWSGIEVPSSRANTYSVPQLVTIASLVEREASIESERPLVSSVIDNRLALGRRLQFCSTVQFLLPGKAKSKLRLTNADLATSSPYNTYLHEGLPPGPIANPGKNSLEAAVKPAQTTFLYFVLTGKDGRQTFASTSEEFAMAKAKSKAVFGR